MKKQGNTQTTFGDYVSFILTFLVPVALFVWSHAFANS